MNKPRKFRNVPVVVDGIRFDSKKEARRWGELQLLWLSGEIADLKRQVGFKLDVGGVHICDYRADFTYREKLPADAEGVIWWSDPVVEDSKGVATPEFKLKAKLMKAIHGIDVRLS